VKLLELQGQEERKSERKKLMSLKQTKRTKTSILTLRHK
jgi:hypothetical protein